MSKHSISKHGSSWSEYVRLPDLREVPTTVLFIVTQDSKAEQAIIQQIYTGTTTILGVTYRILALEIVARLDNNQAIARLELQQEM